jgi:hypothetical protein
VVIGTSRDARLAIAVQMGSLGAPGLALMDLTGEADPVELGLTAFVDKALTTASIAPDNRWALLAAMDNGRHALVVADLSGAVEPLPIAFDNGLHAWFDADGDTIYYWTKGQAANTMMTATDLWRVAWQAGPTPQLGEREHVLRLEDPVLISGFDHARERFLATTRKLNGKHRIHVQTNWAPAER